MSLEECEYIKTCSYYRTESVFCDYLFPICRHLKYFKAEEERQRISEQAEHTRKLAGQDKKATLEEKAKDGAKRKEVRII
jgi:hypothetical protein